MIIVKILGGLGNQFFQYAAATALAQKNNTDVRLDISSFGADALRNFELGFTNAKFSIATDAEIKLYKATNSFERIKERLTPYSIKKFYKQPYFHYDPKFLSLPNNIYIQGYFQSEKYFSSISEQIKKELSFSFSVPDHLSGLIKEMSGCNSVSIHIRKGDYQNPEMRRVHGILSPAYYQQAIRLMKQKLKNVHFFLFSDEKNISGDEYGLTDAKIVSGTFSKSHLEDFLLMSLCKNNIIANSSFSWWAAWLNSNPNKIIAAPEKWFNMGPKDSYDIIPPRWIRL